MYLCLKSERDARLYVAINAPLLVCTQEMAPIVYTPTVGWVAINYHKLYRRPRGMYFSIEDKGEMVRPG